MKNCTYLVRAVLCLCVFLIAGRSFSESSPFTHQGLNSSTGDYLGFLQYKPSDYDSHPTTKYPLIVFLHGIGERGNGTTELDNVSLVGLPRIILKGNKMKFTWNGKTETFIVLAPQCPVKYPMWPATFMNEIIDYAKKNLRVDNNRIYLTGLSMGGGGSMRYISDDKPDNAKNLAAMCTIAAPCTFRTGQYAADAHLPIWSFHAEDDPTASVQCDKTAFANLWQWNVSPKPMLDLWPTGGHIVWDRVYTDTNYQYQGVVNIYEWFLGQNRSLPVNVMPVARAADASITTGTATATLDASASTDADGKLVRFVWKKISGPDGGVIATPMGTCSKTTVTGLTRAGIYKYAVFAVDDRAAFTSDTISVTVTVGDAASATAPPNILPVAKAGADVAITLPVNSVVLDGSASSDADGSIAYYSWAKISGPAPFLIANTKAATTRVSNLVEGTYSFKLLATDNRGGTSADTMTVTVHPAPPPPNVAPTANAGANQTITLPDNSATLNGGSSSDPDGTIVQYSWTQISGAAGINITNNAAKSTTVTGLTRGTFSFRLQVKDNDGATDADTVQITVNAAAVPPPPPNVAPVAKAGTNITITLPVNIATLNGSASSDADGTIAEYSWNKVSGPSQFTIASPRSSVTQVMNLIAGTYSFCLQVKDNNGEIARDTVTVAVLPALNASPVADAGQDFTVNLPDPVIRLNGLASSDPDGTIVSYSWIRVSGPTGLTITNSTTATPGVSGVVMGEYIFRLTVKDNAGATASDDVKVTVLAKGDHPAPPEAYNFAPVANAGPDQTIGITETALLDGSASNDDDRSVDTYTWRQISGTSSVTIGNPSSISASVSGMTEGDYLFELTMTDNFGASSKDSVLISVTSNLRLGQQLTLYPNPARSNVMVQMTSDTAGKAKISIYNTAGILVKSVATEKKAGLFRNNIDVSDLQPGIYYIEANVGQKQKLISKFIKK